MGKVGTTASSIILINPYQISTSTEVRLTLKAYSFDLNTFLSTSTQPICTYNRPKSRNWEKWVLPSTDHPEQSIPDINLYWVPAESRDFQLWIEYLPKHLDPTKQYLQ